MKIKATIGLLLLACSSFATTINWEFNSSDKVYIGTKSTGSKATAYVVYLGASDLSGYSFTDIVAMTPVGTAKTAAGYVTGAPVSVDSTKIGNYASFMEYTLNEVKYYNVSASLYNLTAQGVAELLSDGTALPASSFDFVSTQNADNATKTIGGGWYVAAVPEPATGALALAGITLLLKRRKAAKA